MEAAIQKKATLLRLPVELIDRLKKLARHEHRSLNNYVECILSEAAYSEPNATTLAAIEEARSGRLRSEKSIDLSSPDAMFKSMGI